MSPKDEKKQVLLYSFKYIFNLKSRCLLHFLLCHAFWKKRQGLQINVWLISTGNLHSNSLASNSQNPTSLRSWSVLNSQINLPHISDLTSWQSLSSRAIKLQSCINTPKPIPSELESPCGTGAALRPAQVHTGVMAWADSASSPATYHLSL